VGFYDAEKFNDAEREFVKIVRWEKLHVWGMTFERYKSKLEKIMNNKQ
jgi:hypothetical protein